jgi:hypothetical protein
MTPTIQQQVADISADLNKPCGEVNNPLLRAKVALLGETLKAAKPGDIPNEVFEQMDHDTRQVCLLGYCVTMIQTIDQ